MKHISRYFFSIRGYLWSLYKTFASWRSAAKFFSYRYQYVHIVLPGPSARSSLINFLSSNPDLSRSCILFVNHGIVLAPSVPATVDKYFFTADSTRAKQILLHCQNELSMCLSIFSPFHFFHLRNFDDFNGFDIYLTSKACWSKQYGVSTQSFEPSRFRALDRFPVSYGFGSLCYSMQVALLLRPESIYVYGCDFGIPSSSDRKDRYLSDLVPVRLDTPYELIRAHFLAIQTELRQLNVKVKLISS